MTRAYDLPPGRRPRATFCILAHRSAESIFGPAVAPVQGPNGTVRTFAVEHKAVVAADRMLLETTTPNVRYTVARWDLAAMVAHHLTTAQRGRGVTVVQIVDDGPSHRIALHARTVHSAVHAMADAMVSAPTEAFEFEITRTGEGHAPGVHVVEFTLHPPRGGTGD